MTDLDRGSAPAGGYARALRLGAGLVAVSLLLTPVAGLKLGVSYPLAAMLLAASIACAAFVALLLLLGARATRSEPAAILGAGFVFAVASLVPYAFLSPGMFPGLAGAIGADPLGYEALWFTWQAGLLVAMLAYQRLRYAENAHAKTHVRGRVLIGGLLAFYATVTPLAIWGPDLPALFGERHDALPFELAPATGTVLLALTVVIESLRRSKRARELDAWIGLVAFAIIAETYANLIGAGDFSLGWYAARAIVLAATGAMLAAQLMQAARLYHDLIARAEELESEAHTDTLTGLPNRRRFDEEFVRAFGSAIRRASPIGVALIDIDRFKQYNDSFGHQAGDAALKTIAAAIAESVERSGDFANRYGGEEFVVILEDTTLGGATAVAERIRRAVLDTAIRAPGGGILTVSAGVAARLPGSSREALLRQADAALYEAKHAGRNRVESWHSAAIAPIGSAYDETLAHP